MDVDRTGRRTQITYRIYLLSSDGKAAGDPIELEPVGQRFVGAAALDGRLLLSNQQETLVIPLRPES